MNKNREIYNEAIRFAKKVHNHCSNSPTRIGNSSQTLLKALKEYIGDIAVLESIFDESQMAKIPVNTTDADLSLTNSIE